MKAHLQSTAYHEAGHAVAAWSLGVSVGTVTIEPIDDTLGSAAHSRIVKKRDFDAFEFGSLDSFTGETAALRTCIIALAGIAAQRRYSARSVRHWHGRSDREKVFLIVERVVGEDELEIKHWYGRALRRTERIIEWRWPAVKALARALLKKHTLSGKEALTAIQSAYALPKAEQLRIAKIAEEAVKRAAK